MNEYEIVFLYGKGLSGYIHAEDYKLENDVATFYIGGELVYTAEDVREVKKVTK